MFTHPKARRVRLLGGGAVVLLVVGFCLGLIRANPSVFWNDDYQVSILPVFADVARSWREGHWPLLSPYSWACGNLAGEYQYGTFSLFVNLVVVAVWQFPLGFAAQAAALSVTHLGVLALGAYLLARGRRLPAGLAVAVGLVAALNGWEIGWGATDWFGALAADAWLPWAWWAFEAAMRERPADAGKWARLRVLWPGVFIYLVLTGGFPYTVVRLALVTAWLGARAVAARRWRSLLPLAGGWAAGLGLSAPAWLSLLAAIQGSGRAGGAGVGNFAWTVPAGALPGLILPDWTVSWHDFANLPATHAALELAGGFVPVAGLVAASVCLRGRLWRTLRWELVLLGVVLAVCLLPSPGMFRWSFRWLPLFHLVLALTAARALHALAARRGFGWRGNPGLWACVLAGGAWAAMILAGTGNADAITWHLPAWTLACALGWLGLARAAGRRRAAGLWVPALVVFASLWATYAHLYTNPGTPKYGLSPGLAQAAPLSPERLYLSLYREVDSSYRDWQVGTDFGTVVRPGSTGMFAGVRTVNGYSPIMPPGVGRLWNMETHGSIPEDVGRRLLREEASHHGLLAGLGVDGLLIASDYPLEGAYPPTDEWEQVFTSAEGTIYHRRGGPLPAAHVETIVPSYRPPAPVAADVHVVDDSRSGISLDLAIPPTEGRITRVVFHRAFFPGYEAVFNGAPVPVASEPGDPMPVVYLDGGSRGRLTLRYRPRAVVVGGAVAALTLLAMGAAAWLLVRNRPAAG